MYEPGRKSKPVIVVPYRDEWPQEFRRRGAALRSILGNSAARIDHIGSTSVPGLAAKDIIDLQIGVDSLSLGSPWYQKLVDAGYQMRPDIQSDHQPPWFAGD